MNWPSNLVGPAEVIRVLTMRKLAADEAGETHRAIGIGKQLRLARTALRNESKKVKGPHGGPLGYASV